MTDVTIVNAGLLLRRPNIPTGPLIIVAALEKAGYNVEFRDYQIVSVPRRPSPRTFKSFLDDSADIIGISVMCNALPTVLGAIKLLKEERPQVKVFLGGPGCRELAEDILRFFPVDALVLGEGEYTAPELLQALKHGGGLGKVRGIAYKDDGRMMFTEARPAIEDLDSVPFPAYHWINLDSYDNIATILTARGCPFSCKFCSAHLVPGRRVRYRSVNNIMEELSMLAPKAKYLAFLDDTFVLDRERVDVITRNVKQRWGLRYACNGKVSLMDSALLKGLATTGCFLIFYGIESGSNVVLARIGKGHTIERARAVIAQTAELIENVRTSYIWGYPFETLEDFYDTAMSLRADMQYRNVLSQMSLLSPLCGTELTEEFGDTIAFSPEIQSRAGGLPVGEDLSDYPELIEMIVSYPRLFSSFYHFPHSTLNSKLNAVRSIDWIYDRKSQKQNGY